MKQRIVYDRNYNEIEYHEIDENGKTIYSKYTYYHGIKGTNHIVCRIEDSNGWVRKYDKEGNIILDKNNPDLINICREFFQREMMRSFRIAYDNAMSYEETIRVFRETTNNSIRDIEANLNRPY